MEELVDVFIKTLVPAIAASLTAIWRRMLRLLDAVDELRLMVHHDPQRQDCHCGRCVRQAVDALRAMHEDEHSGFATVGLSLKIKEDHEASARQLNEIQQALALLLDRPRP